MLSRSSSAIHASRGCTLSCSRLGARLNSSLASEAGAANVDTPEILAAAPRRSVPKADLFGDISIPSSVGQQGSTKFQPNLDWLADNEFHGSNTLAARLARRVPPKPPTPAPTPAPVAASTIWDKLSQTTDRTRSLRRHSNDLTEWKSPRQADRQPRQREAPKRAARAQTNTDRVRRPQPRAQEVSEVPEGETVVSRGTARPSSKATLAIQIETTDLEKLLGPTEPASLPSSTAIAVSPAEPTSASALRTQLALEKLGGDYSRYFPPELHINSPETRGPLAAAKLVMARRREAGLRQRHRLLSNVQRLVVQKMVGESASASATV